MLKLIKLTIFTIIFLILLLPTWMFGVATYNQSAESVSNKIYISRLNGFKGISIFSYDSHKNNLEWFRPITKTFGTNSLD